uniref:Uncharacterized protein n=1 Tax=Geospiza parvula TaxID=87175 RepID=A0A8C3MB68_GEOPR
AVGVRMMRGAFPSRMLQRRRWGCSAAMAPMEQHNSVGQKPLSILFFVPLDWFLFGSFICMKVLGLDWPLQLCPGWLTLLRCVMVR